MKTYLKYGLSGLLLLTVFACNRDNLAEPKPLLPKEQGIPRIPRSELKGLWNGNGGSGYNVGQNHGSKLEEDRYLGESYDLMTYRNNNSYTFLRGVLDLEEEAWSPFGGEVAKLKPNVKIIIYPKRVRKQSCQTLSEMLLDRDSIVIHSGKRQFAYRFHYEELDQLVGKKNYVRRTLHEVEKEVFYENFTPQIAQSYLRDSFVQNLKITDADKLVELFGTHLVGRYYLGSTLDLQLHSDPYIFTEEETAKIESWLWESEGKASCQADIVERMYPEFFCLHYRQMGSDYLDNNFSYLFLANLYGMVQDQKQIREEEWRKEFVPNNNRFVSLDEKHRGLIAIPDLIDHIPLKIKYTAGILHRVARNNNKKETPVIHYVLSDPKTHQPIRFNNQPLIVNLKMYKDTNTYVHLGDSKHRNYLDERSVKGLQRKDTSLPPRWEASIVKLTEQGVRDWERYMDGTDKRLGQPTDEGLWLLKSVDNGDYYLCRDLKLRTEKEDKGNLRYWLLNPIMPDEVGRSSFDMSRLFIQ